MEEAVQRRKRNLAGGTYERICQNWLKTEENLIKSVDKCKNRETFANNTLNFDQMIG